MLRCFFKLVNEIRTGEGAVTQGKRFTTENMTNEMRKAVTSE